MKLSTIYKRAAKLQEAGMYEYPCWAIASACGGAKSMWMVESTPASKFTRVFSGESPKLRSVKYVEARYNAREEGIHPHDFDVVALCLAAAVVEGK